MAKHSHHDIDVDEIIDSMNMTKGLRSAVLQLTPDKLAALLADLANSANLSTAALKQARVDLPLFSTVKWSQFAASLKLPRTPSQLRLVSFQTPRYRLPPSLHQAMFENAWRWQDVYREKVDQEREEAKVRLLEPVCQPHSDFVRFLLVNDK